MNTLITKESLIEFGMVEPEDHFEAQIYPLSKTIIETEDGNVQLLVSRMRNADEICLMLPAGDMLYLNVQTIEQLRTFELAISEYEPNF